MDCDLALRILLHFNPSKDAEDGHGHHQGPTPPPPLELDSEQPVVGKMALHRGRYLLLAKTSKQNKRKLRPFEYGSRSSGSAVRRKLVYPAPRWGGSESGHVAMVSGYVLDGDLCVGSAVSVPLSSLEEFGIDAISFRGCEWMMEMVASIETIQSSTLKHRLSVNLRRRKKSATAYNDKMKIYRRTLRKLEETMTSGDGHGGGRGGGRGQRQRRGAVAVPAVVQGEGQSDGDSAVPGSGRSLTRQRKLQLRQFSNALEFDYRNKLSAQQLVSSLSGQSRNELKSAEKALPETILNLLKYGEGDHDEDDLFLAQSDSDGAGMGNGNGTAPGNGNVSKHAVDFMMKRIDDVFMELSLDRMSRNSFKSWIVKHCRINRRRYEHAVDRLFTAIATINKVHYLDFVEPQHIGNVAQFLFHQQQHQFVHSQSAMASSPVSMHKTTIKLLLTLYGEDRHSISHHDLFQSMLNNSHSLFPNDYQLVLHILDCKKESKHRQCLRKQRAVLSPLQSDLYRDVRGHFNSPSPSPLSTESSVSTITAITKSDAISPVITARDLEKASFPQQQLDVVLFILIAFRCEQFVDERLITEYKAKSAAFQSDAVPQSGIGSVATATQSAERPLSIKQFQLILFRFLAPNQSEMIENGGDCSQIVEALFANLTKSKQRMVTATTATAFFDDIEKNIDDELHSVNAAFDFYDKQNRHKIYPSDLLRFEDTILGIILQKDLHRMFHQLFLQYIVTSIDTHLTRKQFQQLFELKHPAQTAPALTPTATATAADDTHTPTVITSPSSIHWEIPQIIKFFSGRSCD